MRVPGEFKFLGLKLFDVSKLLASFAFPPIWREFEGVEDVGCHKLDV
jgi:hypothetical protein